ncbi:MAG: 30S ribosomal protein THX [Verrucomicrobiota bacterium]
MGKGDKRTRRGKTKNGSYGNVRSQQARRKAVKKAAA